MLLFIMLIITFHPWLITLLSILILITSPSTSYQRRLEPSQLLHKVRMNFREHRIQRHARIHRQRWPKVEVHVLLSSQAVQE
jgi:hypothetical protein